MNYKIVKTIDWLESKEHLCALAQTSLGRLKNSRPLGFVEFVAGYISVSRKRMCAFLSEFIKNTPLCDVTETVVTKENECLFLADNSSAIDIILRYLNTLNSGKKLGFTWAYLDTEKKAIVHFVNRGSWYAEAFFAAKTSSSALHVIAIGDEMHFLPVVFGDIAKFQLKVHLAGNVFLQHYFPRDVGDFLRKRRPKKHRLQAPSCEEDTESASQKETYKSKRQRWNDIL